MGAPRYIITGGAGFVGSNLAAALCKRDPGASVVIVDNFRTGTFANITSAFDRAGLSPFDGECIPEDYESLAPRLLVQGARAVFHLAAITDTTITDEAEMVRVNATGFQRLLAACADEDVPLVYASSAATYGAPPLAAARTAFPLEAAGRPNNVYGFSKWLMECDHRRLMLARASVRTPKVVGLRYFNVFGQGEGHKGHMASMVFQLAQRLLRGEAPRVFRDGSQSRDQVYVDDVVACTIAGAGLSGGQCHPGVYNVGSGTATSFNEIISALRAEFALAADSLPTEYFDMPPSVRAYYQDFTCADMSATAHGLGWTPAWQPGEAIRSYARWLMTRAR